MVKKDKKSHLENRWLHKKFGWAAYASLCSAYCKEIIKQFALAHGVSIISGSLSGAQGAFPARQISLYYCRGREVLQQKSFYLMAWMKCNRFRKHILHSFLQKSLIQSLSHHLSHKVIFLFIL